MSNQKPLYIHSLKDAVAHNERDEWRDSYRENCDCARAIERAIASHYKDNKLEECAEDLIAQYGFDRVNWVLTNTIQQKKSDGHFSKGNKEWAKRLFIPKDDVRWHFCVESDSELIDIFTDQVRQAWKNLALFDNSHCTNEGNYEGKLLVLKPYILMDEYKSPDFQLFYATGGFGCHPEASGRKVFGYFFKDNEETSFFRSNFYGVIKEENLPDWAKEKLLDMQTAKTEETNDQSPIMGGM